MNSEKSSEPPEEPFSISDHHALSPASPKPIHFPAPSKIPVLEMQMDVGFNQTEVHMSDPAMHNTEVRPDFWRDPNEITLEDEQSQPEPQASAVPEVSHDDDTTSLHAEIVGMPNAVSNDSTEPTADSKESALPQPPSSASLHSAASNGVTVDSSPAEGASHVQSDSSPQPPNDYHSTANIANPADDAAKSPVQHTTTNGVDTAQAILASLSPHISNKASNPDVSAVNDMNVLPTDLRAPNLQTQMPPKSNIEHVSPDTQMLLVNADGLPAEVDSESATMPVLEEPGLQTARLQSILSSEYLAMHAGVGDQHRGANEMPSVDESAHHYHLETTAASTHPSAGTAQAFGMRSEQPTSHAAFPSLPFAQNETSATNSQTASVTNNPLVSRREMKQQVDETVPPEDRPWNAEVQRKYDHFIEEERKYVSEGRWEQFPPGSRLFVGNLSSEKVTKRDIFHVFHHYGNLAQISIKQAYGFVQFIRAEDCSRALDGEQGTQIRDKRIHLEVSKPQKSRNQEKNKERRSRSPEHRRGGKSNVDRYVSGDNNHGRRRQRSGAHNRSPTPPRYRDRYEDRYRARSPENYGRNRYRSPSPKRDDDEDLPLPRRSPRDVPDVQILVLDNLDREFIGWVENAFASKGVHVDVLVLSPRLPEQAVVRRQIVEGVIAVSKLTKRNQDTGKIGLQIFDRSAGANNVRFEEYDNLDPPICAELVLRARQMQKQATSYTNTYSSGQYSNGTSQQQSYGSYGGGAASYGQQQPPPPSHSYPPPGLPPTAHNPATAGSGHAPPNLQNLISSLDPSGLQNLLSAMNHQPPPGMPATQVPNFSSNGPGYGNQQIQPPSNATAALQQNPQALAELLQRQQNMGVAPAPAVSQNFGGAPQSAGAAVNMQDILARLGTYKP